MGTSVHLCRERELQALVLDNLGVLSAARVFSTLLRPVGLGAYLARLRAAYRRGHRSRELLSVAHERLWEQPVAMLAEQPCVPIQRRRGSSARWPGLREALSRRASSARRWLALAPRRRVGGAGRAGESRVSSGTYYRQ